MFCNIPNIGLQNGYKNKNRDCMVKVKLTAGRIAAFVCKEGKAQEFLWCAEVPGLGVRATPGSNDKRYIFQAKVNGKTMRVTIGRVKAWSIPDAQMEARRLQMFIDKDNDPLYKQIIKENPAQNKKARECLGKAKAKNDVLQKEQLKNWFEAVKQINNPVISAYLQALLLTGARREELAALRWVDVDFQWNSLTIRDKVEGRRIIPLTPYVAFLLSALPKRNEWVFSSLASSSGRITDPNIAHAKACEIAGLYVSLHGLRRSFASLCEWTEVPAGIAAQIQGHAPQGVREQNYIRRPLDLLRKWQVKFEEWILQEGGVYFDQKIKPSRLNEIVFFCNRRLDKQRGGKLYPPFN
jgi:integrase